MEVLCIEIPMRIELMKVSLTYMVLIFNKKIITGVLFVILPNKTHFLNFFDRGRMTTVNKFFWKNYSENFIKIKSKIHNF